LPSRQDPFPIAMLEAMAHGLPVVGTRIDGIAEQIAPTCGVLMPPESPVALADAIVALARQSVTDRAAMGAAARKRVADCFSIDRQAMQLAEAYGDAIGAFSRRSAG